MPALFAPSARLGTGHEFADKLRQLRLITRSSQDFALADMVRGADNPFGLHTLDDSRRSVVADL
jgi:hypothetical protein